MVVLNPEAIVDATPKTISEAYHKAKADGSNPELVKAVEQSLPPQEVNPLTKTFDRLDEIATEFDKGEVTKELRDERKAIFSDPKVKRVNDNFKSITTQLEEKGLIKKEKLDKNDKRPCP
jgi:hypothetical protein